jgi:hypothetical protein
MRFLSALFALLAFLVSPSLGDFLARTCATAPCCVTGSGVCPMHAGASNSTNKCRLRSCEHHDAPAQITPGVAVTHAGVSPAGIQPRRYAERDADLVLRFARKPESPPPRRG